MAAYRLPARGKGGDGPYRYAPPRRPPRRTAGGTVAGLIGGAAALFVLGILGYTAYDAFAGQEPPHGVRGTVPPREAATASRLYRTGELRPVQCRLPALTGEPGSMRGFMDELSDCLDASWTGQFDRGGLRYAPPRRVFWEQPGRSPCGSYPSPGASAFYCPANNTMYVGLRHVVEASAGESLRNYAVFARVVAHEYGHHVQDRAGILAYGHRQMERAAPAARTETSRRIELQAQCLAGAFLGAERATLPLTRRQYAAMMADVRSRGDDRKPAAERDHGSGRNYAGWLAEGVRSRGPAACNTWVVDSARVS
ncbi:neutral zinc metallopeptidase [Actinomadura flavalba]|uniref:neutral zinc metallopeptidase n=1 Tax=Actinomadura flavalba TaxID=1120938 RepID=UPI00037699DE|nr:neutral zinc metallopeptidase [Actinomadura flavalba]